MSTVAEFAHEFNAQPHEIAAFAGMEWPFSENDELDPELEAWMRASWSMNNDGA